MKMKKNIYEVSRVRDIDEIIVVRAVDEDEAFDKAREEDWDM